MRDKLILIAFELCFGIKINLVGVISPSELFLLITSFYYIKKLRISHNKDLSLLTQLYIGLIIIQIITETIINNDLNNMAKGIAVNIISYLHFTFLLFYFRKDRKLIIHAAIGYILKIIIFGKSFEDTFDIGDNAFIGFLKFSLVPILTYGFIVIACLYKKINMSILMCIVGFILILLGARSGGGIFFISGIFNYIFTHKRKLHLKNLKALSIICGILLYGSYCGYVQAVKNGDIRSGNTEQLLKTNNPYNPINLLMMGRSEVFVGYVAFTDKPLTGWGAWAKDPHNKYHILKAKISNSIYNEANILSDEIPSHSVLIGSAMMNGIFAFILMCCIFAFTIKKAIFILKYEDPYITTVIILIIDFIWTMLFSPQSAFRYIVPIEIAFILCTYQNIKIKINEKHLLYNDR